MESYTLYQLRTKSGDGEFDYFVHTEAPYLEAIHDVIVDEELDMNEHIIVQLDITETDITEELPEEVEKLLKCRRHNGRTSNNRRL